MLRGGYHIVDLKDTNITTETGATIVGIYEEIEASYRKAILVSGITIDGVEYRDTFVDPTHNDNTYTFTAHGKTFTVSSDNTVKIA